MGSGILANLLTLESGRLPGAAAVSAVIFVIAWLLLIGLTTAFAIRCVRTPGTLVTSLRNPAQSPMWGTVSMGILSVGSATATIVPTWNAHWTSAAFGVDAVLWVIGTILGLYTTLDFAFGMAIRDLGRPTPVWGLPVVAPMVSATTGCALVARLGSLGDQAVLLTLVAACFGTSLVVGGVVFAVAYHHHWRHEPLPLTLRTSLWIPLGVVGQSTAAAQTIAARASAIVRPEAVPAIMHISQVYAIVVLGVAGTALGGYAAVMTVRGFIEKMPFVPGWWAMTFPLGTCALGAQQMGFVHHDGVWAVIGAVLTCCLVGTWSLCVVATIRAIRVERSGRTSAA